MKEDAELQQFRQLMAAPDHWEDGFGIKAMLGGLFVGLIMTPASMYMGLVVGGDISSAAQWVTIILFIEVARRAFTTLKRPEIYVLYYMAGASLAGIGMGNGGLLWNQFIVQSESFRQLNLADKIPTWVTPNSPDVLGTRSFFRREWLVPLGLLSIGMFLQRVDHFGLGYVMYRLTSDVEKLPFPLAPVGAQGISALADASGGQETWRWRVFSFGAMLGMVFAAVAYALPAVSSAFLAEPISIFPLPFKDLNPHSEDFLPAVPLMISFNLGMVLAGMVLPYWAMIGTAIGLLVCMIANPILHKTGILSHWAPGMGVINTINVNYLDFYLSFGLGLTAAIAVIGFWHVFNGIIRRKRQVDQAGATKTSWTALFNPPAGRGDFSLWIAIGIYVFSTTASILMAYFLLEYAHTSTAHLGPAAANSPVTKTLIGVLIFYGFVYTPILSYVSARMEGIVGMSVQVPFVREATFMLTGYHGAAIWFAPFPAFNYGAQTLYFRTTELTGTKITSMIKAEAFIFPVVLIATIVFSQFIWRLAPVPSSAFPYASQMWELTAFRQAMIYSSTLPGQEHGVFYEAFQPVYIFAGLGLALVAYGGMSYFGLPILLYYGLIRGLDQGSITPDSVILQLIGALLGRYYFAKKFGDRWPDYRVVFFAGFTCGLGLVMMLSLGLVFMSKSVIQSAF